MYNHIRKGENVTVKGMVKTNVKVEDEVRVCIGRGESGSLYIYILISLYNFIYLLFNTVPNSNS